MSRPALPRAAVVLLVTACLTVTCAGIRSASDLLGPVMLALVLTITAQPVKDALQRTGLPRWAVSVITVIAIYAALLALSAALAYALAELASLLPAYAPKMQQYLSDMGAWLESRGVSDKQVSTVLSSFDVDRLVSLATTVLGAAASIVSNLFFVVALALFMVFDTDNLRDSLAHLRRNRPHLVDALANFGLGTRSYMGVSTVFGLIVAAVDWLALVLLGVPGAFVWAVLSFVTNFIPNVGFVIGVIPPALIALFEGGPGLMLAVIVAYSVINIIIQSVIQPRYVGDRVGLSPTITLLSLVFWAWALGAIGALLAVPLTLLARALLIEADPDAHWALGIIAGRPPSGTDDA